MFRTLAHAFTGIVLLSAGVHLVMGDEQTSTATSRSPHATQTPGDTIVLPKGQSSELPESAEVDQKIKAEQEFSAHMNEVVAQVAEGRISLDEARENIYYYCLARYPTYLVQLDAVIKGKDVHDELTQILTRFVRFYQEDHGMIPTPPGSLSQPQRRTHREHL
jgi:hypothetical protein